jgi:hypothetical protein
MNHEEPSWAPAARGQTILSQRSVTVGAKGIPLKVKAEEAVPPVIRAGLV